MTTALILGIIGIVLLGIVFAQPLYVILGSLSGLLLLLGTHVFPDFISLNILVEQTRSLAEDPVLLAIPFFIISGAVMSAGDISTKLVDFASVCFRGVPGALAVSAVMGCVFFAAISGSSPVTVIAIGSIVYPSLIKQGYDSRFSAGLLSSAGSLGILIPPSIPMIIYAIVAPNGLMDPPNYNIAPAGMASGGLTDLFLAGVGPGLLLGAAFVTASLFNGTTLRADGEAKPLIGERVIKVLKGFGLFFMRVPAIVLMIFTGAWIVVLLLGRHLKNPPAYFQEGAWARDFSESFWSSFWALMLPGIILGGIYSGLFTPTEAACVSVVYAVPVEMFIYRSMGFKNIPEVFEEATVLIGALLVILAVAQGFTQYLQSAHIPHKLVHFIIVHQFSTVDFLIVVNLMLLVVGCLMDIMSAIMILVPLLGPVAFQLGIHPMHMAIIFIVNLEIGYLTPPMGLNLFVASTIFRKSFGEIIRSAVPFVGMMLVGLIAITYVPTISLGPVSWYNGHGFYVPFPETHAELGMIKVPEDINLLSELADKNLGPAGEQEEEQAEDSGHALSMAEIMAKANAQAQEEATNVIHYDNVDKLLHDFTRLHHGLATLEDIQFEQEEARSKADADEDNAELDQDIEEPGAIDARPEPSNPDTEPNTGDRGPFGGQTP